MIHNAIIGETLVHCNKTITFTSLKKFSCRRTLENSHRYGCAALASWPLIFIRISSTKLPKCNPRQEWNMAF